MITKYTLSTEFNFDKARGGNLCVVVTDEDLVEVSSDSDKFIGTGICVKDNNGFVVLYIDNERYQFNSDGKGSNKKAEGLFVKLGVPTDTENIRSEGSSIYSNVKNTIAKTRGESGEIEYGSPQPDSGDFNIFVDSLNARDQFANQALRGMLSHIEDPAVLSDNEMNYYCSAAYKWAANMLTIAAKVRATIDDQTEDVDDEEEIGALESNTEKLLKNIIVALERTDEKVTPQGAQSPVYYERVSIPALMEFLNNYVKDGNNTVGLKDLIAAINNISGGGQGSGTMNIGDEGLGRSSSHPIHIAVDNSNIDSRIRAWLNATKVEIGGVQYSLIVPNSI